MTGMEFLRTTVKLNVGRFNQFAPVWVLVLVAWWVADGSFWWTAAAVVGGVFLLEVGLVDSFVNGLLEGRKQGHVEGHRCADEAQGQGSVPISELLELCERHGVPMEEVAQLIWRDEP